MEEREVLRRLIKVGQDKVIEETRCLYLSYLGITESEPPFNFGKVDDAFLKSLSGHPLNQSTFVPRLSLCHSANTPAENTVYS
jgi:hypothetical protein